MDTDISYSEPPSLAFEHEMVANADEWANWTTNQIRSAIEGERERTFELLSELLARIQRETIPEVVATARATRPGRAGRARWQAADRQGMAARDGLLRGRSRDLQWRHLSGPSRYRRAAR
jgi:hypothetical protein